MFPVFEQQHARLGLLILAYLVLSNILTVVQGTLLQEKNFPYPLHVSLLSYAVTPMLVFVSSLFVAPNALLNAKWDFLDRRFVVTRILPIVLWYPFFRIVSNLYLLNTGKNSLFLNERIQDFIFVYGFSVSVGIMTFEWNRLLCAAVILFGAILVEDDRVLGTEFLSQTNLALWKGLIIMLKSRLLTDQRCSPAQFIVLTLPLCLLVTLPCPFVLQAMTGAPEFATPPLLVIQSNWELLLITIGPAAGMVFIQAVMLQSFSPASFVMIIHLHRLLSDTLRKEFQDATLMQLAGLTLELAGIACWCFHCVDPDHFEFRMRRMLGRGSSKEDTVA
mmetsp:Transcript_29886/g.79536  ORF Transcript_29886/g.79536 Transcript_29886/m.79536 type:complete len:333 (-) Transcript_29886:250-1248(-)